MISVSSSASSASSSSRFLVSAAVMPPVSFWVLRVKPFLQPGEEPERHQPASSPVASAPDDRDPSPRRRSGLAPASRTRREVLGMPDAAALGDDADRRGRVGLRGNLRRSARRPGAGFGPRAAHRGREWRACGRPGARAFAVGEDVQVGQVGLLDEVQRFAGTGHRFRSGTRRSGRRRSRSRGGVGGRGQWRQARPAQLTAAHALQDQVGAGLEREVQVRHEPGLLGERPPERRVDGRRVERGEAQPRQVRHVRRMASDEVAEAGASPAVARQVDPGQDDLVDPAPPGPGPADRGGDGDGAAAAPAPAG